MKLEWILAFDSFIVYNFKNLQYNTVGRWVAGTIVPLSKCPILILTGRCRLYVLIDFPFSWIKIHTSLCDYLNKLKPSISKVWPPWDIQYTYQKSSPFQQYQASSIRLTVCNNHIHFVFFLLLSSQVHQWIIPQYI